MRIIKLILFCVALCLLSSIGYGQGTVSFGASRASDTSRTAGFLKMPVYATSDSNKVLGVTANGSVVLRTKGTGGGGGSGTVTSLGYTQGYGMLITGTNPVTTTGTWLFVVDSSAYSTKANVRRIADSLNTVKGSGTVTNVSTGYGMLGGPITTAGTVRVDTFTVANRRYVDSGLANIPASFDTTHIYAALADSMQTVRADFVPYTGAIQDVDLGTKGLTAQWLMSDTVQSNTGNLHLHGTGGTGIVVGASGSVLFDNYPTTVIGDSVLSTNSAGALQRYDLKTKFSSYVPYTGATADVNLGAYNLITSLVKTDTVQANSSLGVHIHGTGGLGIMVGAGGGGGITFDSYPTTIAGDSVLTTNSAGAVLRYDLKGKLANYYLASNPNGYTSNTGTVTSVGVVAGTGVSIGGGSPITGAGTYTITNTAPDQTVTITASTNITVAGSYPTYTISATGGGGGGAPLKGISPVTITAGTGDTLVISITPNYTYTITEASTITFNGNNGLIQKMTITGTDTISIDTATLAEGVIYEYRLIQDGSGNHTLYWSNSYILFQGGTTATGRPYQDIGAADISRYFIQKSDANLFVNPVINNRN